MFDLASLKRDWRSFTAYERFEQLVTRVIMLHLSVIILYSLVLIAIHLFNGFRLGQEFIEKELLQDTFGSIFTVLILLEFNHSIALALAKRMGVIQARIVVLLAILVVARKIILLDFKNESLEHLAGISAMGLSLGALYWLLGAGSAESSSTARPPGHG